MSCYLLKAAEADLGHALDWSQGYLVGRERITADLGWAVRQTFGDDDELRVAEQGHDAQRTHVTLSGGVKGRFYLVSNRIRTTDDRVLSQSIVVRIANGRTAE